MGTYLSKPVVEKHIETDVVLDCPTSPLAWACVDMQGWRKTMEDAHVVDTFLKPPPKMNYKVRNDALSALKGVKNNAPAVPEEEIHVDQSGRAKVFAVFDGHGGAEVAKFCNRHLVNVLVKQTKWECGDIGGALKDCFHELDRMIDHPARKEELIQLKLDQMNNNVTGGNNSNPTQPKSILPYSPALSSAQQISEIFKSRFQQRRGKKDKDPNSNNQSQQLSNNDDADMDVESTSTTPETIPPALKSTSPKDDDIADGEVTEALTNTEQNDVSLNSDGAKEGTDIATPNESSDITDDNDESDTSNENADMVLNKVSTEKSIENENKTDENETNDITNNHTNDAKLLLQKLLEISESVDKLKSEKQLLAAMEARTLASGGGAINSDAESTSKVNENSSMTLTDTPSRIQNGRQICNLTDHPIHAGCTSVVAVMIENVLTVANAGDSRAVLCRKGGVTEALSIDHKPTQQREMARISKAGGFINQFGRVNGNLNLSRSIGDLKYKQTAGLPPSEQMITAEPDITQIKLNEGDEFIIIGCDGIWDCLTNDAAVQFVSERIATKSPEEIGTEMLDSIISEDPKITQGIGGDNMTVMIVDLLPQTRSYIKKV